jgi:hypothetical protein
MRTELDFKSAQFDKSEANPRQSQGLGQMRGLYQGILSILIDY